MGTPLVAAVVAVVHDAAVADAAGGAFGGTLPYNAGQGLHMSCHHVCSDPGTLDYHSGDPSGSSHLHRAPCNCPHNPCNLADDPPMVGALHIALQSRSHGGGSPCCEACLVGVLLVEMCLVGVGTGLGGGEGGALGGVESLAGVMCAEPVVVGKCWVGGHDEAWEGGLEAVLGLNGGEEVDEVEEVDDGQFQ